MVSNVSSECSTDSNLQILSASSYPEPVSQPVAYLLLCRTLTLHPARQKKSGMNSTKMCFNVCHQRKAALQ